MTKKAVIKLIKLGMKASFIGLSGTIILSTQRQSEQIHNFMNELTDGFAYKIIENGFLLKERIVNPENVIKTVKESREATQIFTDVKNALVEDETLQEYFNLMGDIDEETVELLVARIVEIMYETGNVTTDSYLIYNAEDYKLSFNYNNYNNAYGVYQSKQAVGTILYDPNGIYINSKLLEDPYARDIFLVTIHEMVHAIQFENLYLNPNLSEFDKALVTKNTYRISSTNRYASTPIEFMSFMISQSIIQEFYNRMEGSNVQIQIASGPLEESYYALYNAEVLGAGFYVTNDNATFDVNNYRTMTVEQLFLANFEKYLEENDIDYVKDELKESYFYKTFVEFMPEDALTVRYADYVNLTYQYEFDNVTEEINEFWQKYDDYATTRNESFLNSYLASFVQKVSCALRYHAEDYTLDERYELATFVIENVDSLSEDHLAYYGLKTAKEDVLEINKQEYAKQPLQMAENIIIAKKNDVTVIFEEEEYEL